MKTGRGSSKGQEHHSDAVEVRSVPAHPPAPEPKGGHTHQSRWPVFVHGKNATAAAKHGLITIAWREHLGLPECPYVYRWRFEILHVGSFRVHHWVGPDDDRAYHDHPWRFLTFVVKGGYTDKSPSGDDRVRAPALRYRAAEHQHTVVPDPGGAWTILLTGPRIRTWGFWVRVSDTKVKFYKARRWFESRGHHPCAED